MWSTNGSGGPFDQLFTNGATNNAVLGLTSGTAELIAASTINLGQLRVSSNGFTLTSGGTTSNFTFNQGFQTVGSARTLNLAVGTGATTSFVATGTGDTSAGALTLNVSSAVSGQGLAINSATAFGATPNANIVVGTTTGGTSGGTRVTVGTDFTMPTGVSLSLSSSVGADFRSTLASFGGTTTWNGAITLNGGGLIHFESTANNFVIAGGVSSGTAATALQLQGTGTGTATGVMSGSMSLTKNGGGAWRITQTDNTFTGNVTIATGTLRVTKLADGGATSSLGTASTPITFGIDTSSGAVLEFVSANASSTNRGISLQGGGGGNAPFYTIRASGTSPPATLTLTGNVTTNASTADRTLILDGTNVGNNTLSGTISSSGGTVSLNKSGSGTWVLSGNNSYTGPTNVTVGTLVINGNQSAATGAVTVGSPFAGPATLGGIGTIGGAVSVVSGSTIRGDSGTGTGNLTLLADTTIAAGANAGTRGNLLTQLSVSGGVITGNSKLTLSGANTDLNFNNLSGTNTFRITLGNDADLIGGQSYTIVLATAAASSNFQRNGDGNALFTAADFVVVSGTGTWNEFNNVTLFRDNTNLRLNFTPVPEPTSVGLIAAAAGLLTVGRRRLTRPHQVNG